MFEEELAKIGLTLEEAYGTPGQGGMCPNLYIYAHLTLTAKQVLNALCLLIENRYEHSHLTHNQSQGIYAHYRIFPALITLGHPSRVLPKEQSYCQDDLGCSSNSEWTHSGHCFESQLVVITIDPRIRAYPVYDILLPNSPDRF